MILIKEAMSYSQALDIFGIEFVPDETELKNIFKKLSLQHHPDRGGSLSKMQDVNSAYDILKKNVGKANGSINTKFDHSIWDKIEKRNKEEWSKMKGIFESSFDEKKLKEYAEEVIGQTLTVEAKEFKPYGFHGGTFSGYNNTVKIRNEDNTIALDLQFQINYNVPSASGLAAPDMDEKDILYTTMVVTSFYYNRRNAKLSQNSYQWKRGVKALIDFEEVIPKDKIIKAMGKSTTKKFRKADMLLGLAKELNASFQGNDIFLYPFGKDTKFYITGARITLMKVGSYMVNGIQAIHPDTKKYKYSRFTWIGTIYETEEDLIKLTSTVKLAVKEVEKKKLDLVKDYDEVIKIFDELLKEQFDHKNR